jgi:uncharacterized protein YfiM (DUF2279 family)
MKKTLIALTLATATSLASAAGPHKQFGIDVNSVPGNDKTLHVLATTVISAGTVAIFHESENRFLIGFGTAMAVGILKEASDATRKGGSGWSNKDLAADLIGSLLGATIADNLIVAPMLGDVKGVSISGKF